MVLVSDLDLDALKKLRLHGSVRNMADRRTDIYDLKRLKPNGRKAVLQQHADENYIFSILNPSILKNDKEEGDI